MIQDQIMSVKQKEINRIRKYTKLFLNKMSKQKNQMRMDYKFKAFIKDKFPDVYIEATKEVMK